MKAKILKLEIAVECSTEDVKRDTALRSYHTSDWPGMPFYSPTLYVYAFPMQPCLMKYSFD